MFKYNTMLYRKTMQNNTNKIGKGFKDAFYSLPHNQMKAVRDTICEETGWEVATFRSKCNGNRNLKPLEVSYLRTIFESFGITL